MYHGHRWSSESCPRSFRLIPACFWFVDEPETACYLSHQERDLTVVQKRRETGHIASVDQMHQGVVTTAFKDWKVWMFVAVQYGDDTV